jgi:hypothetical protein
MSDLNITTIVETFISQITAAVESAAAQRIQAAIAGAFGAPQKRGPGRPAKQAVAPAAAVAGKKTRPKQFCPVPGCKNVAAPVFGMVCKDHKNVAKSKIKKYRAERMGKSSPASAAKPVTAKKVLSPKAALGAETPGAVHGSLEVPQGRRPGKDQTGR